MVVGALIGVLALGIGSPAGADGTTAAPSRPVAGATGIGDPYFPLDGNGGIDVLHYDIADTYAFKPVHISGTTTLRIRATEALSSFHLDLLLPVSSVEIDGAPVGHAKPNAHELVVTPTTPIAEGTVFDVTVTYAGDPADRGYDGEHNWLANGDEVVAMNEPHMAPWWFPSNDHPSDKATYDVSITTDATKQVIGNGVQVRPRAVVGSQATTEWRMSRPMATYLAFFAAGDFAVRRGTSAAGIPWVTAVSRHLDRADFRSDRSLVDQSGVVVDWLQRELGRYPFASTGGVVTSLDPGFALENQSRPTYPWWIDHTTLVHELAHQWFGDSVSLHRWSDVWLNEGFATYMEQRWREAHGGPTTRTWLHNEYRWMRGSGTFWRVHVDAPGAAHLWANAVYYRGAMALAALRDRIGKRDFRTVLRSWVAQHRYGNGTTKELEALAHRVSGQRLGGFWTTWLDTGLPPAETRANGF